MIWSTALKCGSCCIAPERDSKLQPVSSRLTQLHASNSHGMGTESRSCAAGRPQQRTMSYHLQGWLCTMPCPMMGATANQAGGQCICQRISRLINLFYQHFLGACL